MSFPVKIGFTVRDTKSAWISSYNNQPALNSLEEAKQWAETEAKERSQQITKVDKVIITLPDGQSITGTFDGATVHWT